MRARVFLVALGLVLALVSNAARAQFDDDWRGPPDRGQQAQPLDRILPTIRRNHPGRFYDAEGPFVGGDGQMHYRVKWMTPEGRVEWFDADARTGRVLGTGGGRHDFGPDSVPYDRDQSYPERRFDRGDRPDNYRGHGRPDDFDGDGRGGRGGGQGWGGGFWDGGNGEHHHGH